MSASAIASWMFSPLSPIAAISEECSASMSPRIASDVRLLLEREHLGVEHLGTPAVAADDSQELVGVDLVLELAQEPVERQHQPVGTIGAQLAGIEDRRRRLHRRVHQVGRQPMLAQEAVEGGVARHPRLDHRVLGAQHDVADRIADGPGHSAGWGAEHAAAACQHEGESRDPAEHEVSAV